MKVISTDISISKTIEVENEGKQYYVTVFFKSNGKIIDQQVEEIVNNEREDVSESVEQAIMDFLETNGHFDSIMI